MKLDHETIKQADEILSRGLCSGLGEDGGQMCIEAAASVLAGEPFSDAPTCVHAVVRSYSIRLNDAGWSSADARASGLRSLLLAQLGSQDIDGLAFAQRLAELTIRELIPRLLREALPGDRAVIEAAKRCEREGTGEAARAAAAAEDAARAARDAAAAAVGAAAVGAASYAAEDAARAAINAADAASYAAINASVAAEDAARAAAAAEDAARAARDAAAANAAAYADSYLRQSVELAVRVLQEMDAPGCQLLEIAK